MRSIGAPITCFTCRHFEPWSSNPTAAVGRCLHNARHGYHFAGELHRCIDHAQVAVPKAESSIDD